MIEQVIIAIIVQGFTELFKINKDKILFFFRKCKFSVLTIRIKLLSLIRKIRFYKKIFFIKMKFKLKVALIFHNGYFEELNRRMKVKLW